MKISVRNLEPTKVKLTVTVEPEELNPYLDAARKEIAKQVNVPGFRKGHVPGKIIDQRIGFAAVAGEAVNDAVPELYSKALDEKKIRPMAPSRKSRMRTSTSASRPCVSASAPWSAWTARPPRATSPTST